MVSLSVLSSSLCLCLFDPKQTNTPNAGWAGWRVPQGVLDAQRVRAAGRALPHRPLRALHCWPGRNVLDGALSFVFSCIVLACARVLCSCSCFDGIVVLDQGPGCLLVYYGYHKRASWRAPVEIATCTLQIMGTIVFVFTEVLFCLLFLFARFFFCFV